MSSDLATQAVNFALTNNWQEAIKTNLLILKENPKDVEALNRLAHAYKETSQVKLSQKTYRKVLQFDHFNPIAQKNLKLLENSPKYTKKQGQNANSSSCPPETFLEEPGKTKIVNLVNPASASVLLTISCGNQVNFLVKRRTVVVTDLNGTYLGALPDDLSAKLIRAIKAGNRYEVFIKTVTKNSLSVFTRELFRCPRLKNQPTFPIAGGGLHLLSIEEAPTEKESGEEPVIEDGVPLVEE